MESLAYLQHVFLNGVEDGHGEIYSAKELNGGQEETKRKDSRISANVRAESVLIVSKCCEMEVRQKLDQVPQGQHMVPKEYFQHDKIFLVSVGRRIADQYIEIHAFKRGTYYVFEAYEHHQSSHYRGTVISYAEEMKEILQMMAMTSVSMAIWRSLSKRHSTHPQNLVKTLSHQGLASHNHTFASRHL